MTKCFLSYQGTVMPAMFKGLIAKLFYKRKGRTEPDLEGMEQGVADFKTCMAFFKSYYLKDQQFICGDKISIGDVFVACAIEQVRKNMQNVFELAWN